MRALLKPPNDRPKLGEMTVTLLGRCARNTMIKVCGLKPGDAPFAVPRHRLFAEGDRTRPLTRSELDALDWVGAGNDPALGKSASMFNDEVRP